jgi:hypothetical protein
MINLKELISVSKAAVSGMAIVFFIAVSAPGQTPATTGQSTIRGRAIYNDSERPARRTRIILFGVDDVNQRRTAITDGRGEFIFKNLPAGQYQILADYAGYTNGGPSIDLKKRKPVAVSLDGTGNSEITLRTERGGAITGKITYPDGEPAVGAQINVLIKQGKQWSHASLVSTGAQTDDRGIYRIYPLPPGEYVVSVIEQSLIVEERDGGSMQTTGNKSITPYYYGDASSYKTATIIQVDLGREVNNINITLADRATYKIAGTVTAGGKPLANTYLRLKPHNDGLGGPTLDTPWGPGVRADKDGNWSFLDIPDGRYDIELDQTADQYRTMRSENAEPKTGRKFVYQRLEVTVAGADLTELEIPLSEGGRISGTIVVEGDKPPTSEMNLFTQPLRNDGTWSIGASTRVNPQTKGLFLIEAVPTGENWILGDLYDRKYYLKSISWNGKDLLREPLNIAELSETKDVRIILSDDKGSLAGQLISAESKKPLVRESFFLASVDEARWTRKDAILLGLTDGLGGFKLSGAPGDYILCVWPASEDRPGLLPLLKACAAAGPRVTLKRGEPSKVAIVVPNQSIK